MLLGVSLPGTPLAADSTPCREGVAPSPSDRLRKLRNNGKHANVVVTAIARELLGFIWAIVIEQTRTQQEKQGLNAC